MIAIRGYFRAGGHGSEIMAYIIAVTIGEPDLVPRIIVFAVMVHHIGGPVELAYRCLFIGGVAR